MIGLSTILFYRKNLSGEEILKKANLMGFNKLEIEYRISKEQFFQIKKFKNKYDISVVSLHNYCYRPDFVDENKADGDFFKLSSLEDEEWKMALKYSIRTIENADDINARFVVFHFGKVDIDFDKEKFHQSIDKGLIYQEEGRRFRNEIIKARKEKASKHLDRVLKAIDKLLNIADKYSIKIGVENRYYPHQIPDFEEVGVIMREFEGGPIGFWLDFGHAVVQGNWNLPGLDDYLDAYKSYLLGLHIHDCEGRFDHKPPGFGKIDFNKYKDLLKSNLIKILEIKYKYNEKEVVEGLRNIYEIIK